MRPPHRGARRRRAVGLWVGLALVGIAAGTVSGFATREHAYTVRQLTAHWQAPYDLVVFPKGHAEPSSALVDPNTLDAGPGGITLAQYHRIEQVPGVEIAAPLAPIGYLSLNLGGVNLVTHPQTGQLYRMTEQQVNQGLPDGLVQIGYTLVGNKIRVKDFGSVVEEAPVADISANVYLLAVNPAAEARLMGLSHAVVTGRYFTASDEAPASRQQRLPHAVITVYTLPLLLTTVSPEVGRFIASVEHLPIPSGLRGQVNQLANTRMAARPHDPLASLSGPVVGRVDASASTIWADIIREFQGQSVSRIDGHSLQQVAFTRTTFVDDSLAVSEALRLRRAASPVPARWPVAVVAQPDAAMKGQYGSAGEPFRAARSGRPFSFTVDPIGFYNPQRLSVVDDPLTHLPLVGYRPQVGRTVLSSTGRAINPPLLVLPDGSPTGLWTPPPEALTPLSAVTPLLGPAPISSIRIKVAGVTHFGTAATGRLDQVAQAITRATGLPVTVMRGASPEQVLIHPGSLAGFQPEGWIETEWVRLGASVEILRQASLSQGVMLGPVLVAAALFAGISAWLGLAGDRRRWAIALAVGVPPGVVWRQLIGQAGLQGLGVAGLAIAAAAVIGHGHGLLLAGPVGLAAALVVVGAMIPAARMIARQDPVQGLKVDPAAGLVRMRLITGGHLGLALAGAAWRRVLLAMGALVLPASVAYGVGLVQIAWHNALHITVLGQYLLVHGGWLMTAAALVTAGLTAVAAAEIAAASAVARRGTWAVGAALGWGAGTAWGAMAVEAGFLGLLAGMVGTGLAVAVLSPLFGVPVVWRLAASVILGVGVVSELAALPAVWTVRRQDPVPVLKGGR
jgi:hypothetical protein